MHLVIRWSYLPVMWFGFVGVAVAMVARGLPMGWLWGWLAVAIAASFATERVVPYQLKWNTEHGDRARDWLHFIVNEFVHMAGLWLMPLLAGAVVLVNIWPSDWPLWLQLLLAIVGLDVGITLCHMASHRFLVLWHFHAPHHSVQRMYGFNGLMKHPVHQILETASGAVPLLLAGMPSDVAILLVFAVNIQLLLQHSNVDYPVGKLRYVFALNQVHRFHHRNQPGKGNVNFGLFLTVWDQLLGTFYYRDRPTFVTGELGIEERPDYPVEYAKQLRTPFLDLLASRAQTTSGGE